MKTSLATLRTIAVLSLALIMFFRYANPADKPSPDEVNRWVAVVSMTVIAVKSAWSRARALRSHVGGSPSPH